MADRIDLRSDTVTRPSPAMREMIASAAVGDDQFGEDPTINQLQDRIAAMLGKEAAIWLPTGTMANQIALRVLTHPGDDVIVSRESHAVLHESGASAANSGVQFTELGNRGVFMLDEFLAAIKPKGHLLYPPTTLVEIENTHNRAGGVVFPQEEAVKICEAAAAHGIASYLDGSRLWNASVATGRTVSECATPFDLVSVALSKGLGAPGGSVLAGSSDVIQRCGRFRRMFGGAMRQIGIFGAAGLFALDHQMKRLASDHSNARLIAETIGKSGRIEIDIDTVQTNILMFHLSAGAPDASTFVTLARQLGLLVLAFGPRTIRAVTHLDVSREQCARAAEIILKIVDEYKE